MAKNKDIYSEEDLHHSRLGERRKFAMADVSGRGKEVVMEVNWNSLAKRKGFIKIEIEGKEVVVSREHLWAILFMFGSAEEQGKMSEPFLKRTQVTKFFKIIGITATQDVKKGTLLNVPLEFTLNQNDNSVIIGKGSMGEIEKRLLKT